MTEFLRFSVDIGGVTAVAYRLQRIEDNAHDLRPVWPAVLAEFRAIVQQAFDTEGGSTASGAWAPLSPRTVAIRARLMAGAGEGIGEGGPAHPILQLSGRLRRALTTDGPNSTVTTTPTSLRYAVGAPVGYFAFHQSGTRKMPRRAPVDLTTEQRHRLIGPIATHITQGA